MSARPVAPVILPLSPVAPGRKGRMAVASLGKDERVIAKLKAYVLDGPDIAALSAFYGGLAG